jgi:hypothetical protein
VNERALRLFNLFMAAICALSGVAIVFFASLEQLASNHGIRGRHGGDFFVGLAALVGEPLARIVVGAMFFWLAWLFWRFNRPKTPGPSRRR